MSYAEEPPPPENAVLEVEWTTVQHGFSSLLSAVAAPEIDHTEQTLRKAFSRWGDVRRVRINAFGDRATIFFGTEAQAEFASFSASKRFPEFSVHLRVPIVPYDTAASGKVTPEEERRLAAAHALEAEEAAERRREVVLRDAEFDGDLLLFRKVSDVCLSLVLGRLRQGGLSAGPGVSTAQKLRAAQLVDINLCGSYASDAQVAALAAALQSVGNASVRTLDLRHCRVTSAGVKALVGLLRGGAWLPGARDAAEAAVQRLAERNAKKARARQRRLEEERSSSGGGGGGSSGRFAVATLAPPEVPASPAPNTTLQRVLLDFHSAAAVGTVCDVHISYIDAELEQQAARDRGERPTRRRVVDSWVSCEVVAVDLAYGDARDQRGQHGAADAASGGGGGAGGGGATAMTELLIQLGDSEDEEEPEAAVTYLVELANQRVAGPSAAQKKTVAAAVAAAKDKALGQRRGKRPLRRVRCDRAQLRSLVDPSAPLLRGMEIAARKPQPGGKEGPWEAGRLHVVKADGACGVVFEDGARYNGVLRRDARNAYRPAETWLRRLERATALNRLHAREEEERRAREERRRHPPPPPRPPLWLRLAAAVGRGAFRLFDRGGQPTRRLGAGAARGAALLLRGGERAYDGAMKLRSVALPRVGKYEGAARLRLTAALRRGADALDAAFELAVQRQLEVERAEIERQIDGKSAPQGSAGTKSAWGAGDGGAAGSGAEVGVSTRKKKKGGGAWGGVFGKQGRRRRSSATVNPDAVLPLENDTGE